MGEQPRPVEDEVERALSSMRASFLSGSEQIATGITSLEEHFARAPEAERAVVAAAVTRLVATHERLTSKVAELPPSSWDSFKVMVSAVKAQQAVLDQVSHLVQEHVLPRQLESLQATPFSAAPPEDDDPPQPVSASFIPDDVGTFRDRDGDGGHAPPLFGDGGLLDPDGHRGDAPPRPVSASFIPDDVGTFHDHGGDGGDVPPLFADGSFLGRDSSRGDPFPDDVSLHDSAGYGGESSIPPPPEAGFPGGAHPAAAERAGPHSAPVPHRPPQGAPSGVRRGVPAGIRPRREPSGFRALAVAGLRRTDGADEVDEEPERRWLFAMARERMAGFSGLAAMAVVGVLLSLFPRDMQLQEMTTRFIELVRSSGDATVTEEPPSTTVAVATEPRSTERVPAAPDGDAAADGEPAARPRSKETTVATTRRITASAKQASAPALAEPARKPRRVAAVPPAPRPAEKQFVPVVFTHKDKATVQRAMSDLKAQYPNVLIGRRGKIVPVDLGEKGIWHRLMVLPAGARPEATKLCDELAEEGYDLCWVKDY